jgi:hypothetical protein
MTEAQNAEAKELALISKVEMRIALASTEKKLEDLLKIYLAPLLLKLGSEHVAVRNKVRVQQHLFDYAFIQFRTPANAVCDLRLSQSASTSTHASSHSRPLRVLLYTRNHGLTPT